MFCRLHEKELKGDISRTSALCVLLMLKKTPLCYCCSFCGAVSLMLLENLKCLENPSARQGCSFLPSSLPRHLLIPTVSLHLGRGTRLLQLIAFAHMSATPWTPLNSPKEQQQHADLMPGSVRCCCPHPKPALIQPACSVLAYE